MAEGDVGAQSGGGAAGLKWEEGSSRPSPPRTWFMMYEWDHLAEGVSVVPGVMILDRFFVPELLVSGKQLLSLSFLSSEVITGPASRKP